MKNKAVNGLAISKSYLRFGGVHINIHQRWGRTLKTAQKRDDGHGVTHLDMLGVWRGQSVCRAQNGRLHTHIAYRGCGRLNVGLAALPHSRKPAADSSKLRDSAENSSPSTSVKRLSGAPTV